MDVALKVTYNDGGETIDWLGFRDVCSDDIIKYNTLIKKRANCSDSGNPCMKYAIGGFKLDQRPVNRSKCYESSLFTDWRFGAGKYHKGKRKGQPIPVKGVNGGDIAILTTLFPKAKENERKIIGLFKISKVVKDQKMGNGFVADGKMRIELDKQIASGLNFWDFYKNSSNSEKWNTGLFRYMNENEVEDIIDTVYTLVNDDRSRNILLGMKKTKSPPNKIPTQGNKIIRNVALKRKYGPAGEGPDHRRLKLWVKNNPQFLGLSNVVSAKEEPSDLFITNDTPDIYFECKNGECAVVEIETNNPWPGAYQALKYKAMLCGKKNENLDSKSVKSYLVAWNIPEDVKDFCTKYGIEAMDKKI
jgi:hypothetical protein